MSFGTAKEDQKFVNIYGLLVGFLAIQKEELHEQENTVAARKPKHKEGWQYSEEEEASGHRPNWMPNESFN